MSTTAEFAPAPPTRRRSRVVAVVVVAVIVAVLWIVIGRASSETASNATSSGASVIEQFPVDERQTMQPFTATLLDGTPFDSTAAGAPVTVYNVWGSWCGPCRIEAPDLKQAAEATAGRAAFVGINVRDGLDAALAFERANKVPYPSIRAADSDEALLSFGTSVGVVAVPTTLVVDSEGRIAARVVGATTYSTLKALIEDVLAESDTAQDDPAS